jgi:hypothetical protein
VWLLAFNISNWLLRRRIDAQVRSSGRPVEHRRIGNPYHAVSLEPGPRACQAVREMEGKRYLSTSAPKLPLEDCAAPHACQCRYNHHSDRRAKQDRRVQFPNPHAFRTSERRSGAGRRITD